MSRIISYKGLIAHGSIDTLPLHTNDGKTGYRIVKFNLMPQNPMTIESENVVKIFSTLQTTATGSIDFSDVTLLAAGFIEGQPATAYNTQSIVVFYNIKFNQDIYITHSSDQSIPVNYYIELEQIDLTEDQALVAIVKNLRNEQ